MVRRAVLVALSAAALSFAPTVAIAYAATGVPFTVNASGAKADEAVTLTITPEPAASGIPPKTITKTANASGAVKFEVTLTEDGDYELVSTSASGKVLGTQKVTVAEKGAVIVAGAGAAAGAVAEAPAAAVAPKAPSVKAARAAEAPAAEAPAAKAPAADRQLAFTGFRGLSLAVGGGLLVLTGAGFVLVSRPRATSAVCPASTGSRPQPQAAS